MAAGEANLLRQIIGQEIEEVGVAVVVEEGLVDEFGVVVGFCCFCCGGDGEVEVESW